MMFDLYCLRHFCTPAQTLYSSVSFTNALIYAQVSFNHSGSTTEWHKQIIGTDDRDHHSKKKEKQMTMTSVSHHFLDFCLVGACLQHQQHSDDKQLE